MLCCGSWARSSALLALVLQGKALLEEFCEWHLGWLCTGGGFLGNFQGFAFLSSGRLLFFRRGCFCPLPLRSRAAAAATELVPGLCLPDLGCSVLGVELLRLREWALNLPLMKVLGVPVHWQVVG